MNSLNNKNSLGFMLFENSADQVQKAIGYGLNCFLVDWEDKGKNDRQMGYDTEIRPGTIEDLQNISAIPEAEVWCRLNHFGPWTEKEVESALLAGACGLFLPMVKKVDEVKLFLEYIGGRCSSGILIETVEAASLAKVFSRMPLDRIYFGLNDFTISRNDRFIFTALYDGTVEYVRKEIGNNVLFGFGGATAVNCGTPVPSKNLLQEMARLECSFTFLRRSFNRDIQKYPPVNVIKDIQEYWGALLLRDDKNVLSDHRTLIKILEPLC